MQARVWEETVVIPTYPVGDPSPFPPFDRVIYPYPMLDDIGYPKVERQYYAIFLENDCLKVTVLPEIGGKIWGVWDKIAGRDMFYTPKVVKPGLVSLRGAWTAGGIEFNFPIGHHVYCMSPMHCLPVQEEKRATVWIHQYEYLSGMHWAVGISLAPEAYRVETTIRVHNCSDMPQRYYVWSNAAVPASKEFEFICTAPGTSDGRSFPIHDGIQVSLYRNLDHAADLFARNPQDDFFGYYDHESQYGVLNVANRFEAVGQKLFTWGTGEDGLIWADLLSDSDQIYCEIQRGRFEDQGTWRTIWPQSVEQWSEVWFPVRGIGKPVKATRDGAIGLKSDGGRPQVGVQVVTPLPEAAITLEVNGKAQWQHRGALTPKEIITHPIEAGEAFLTVSVEDASLDRPLFYSSEKKEIVSPVASETDKEPATAEELARAAIQAWQHRNDALAEQLWDKALEQDPGFTPALLAKARKLRWAGKAAEARELVLKALLRDPENPEALYYEGSQEALFKALRHPVWRSAAAIAIARRYPEYASVVEYALASNHTNPSLWAEWIRILRESGRMEEADRSLDRLMSIEPYNLLGIAVRSFGKTQAASLPAELEAHLKDRPESAMVLIPLVKESEAQLLAEWAAQNGVGVRAHYILEFWHPGLTLSGSPTKGLGTVLPSGSVFPHRQDEYLIYQKHPDDPIAQYLLGIWLYAKGRREEGMAVWEKAMSLGLKDAGLCHNLGWSLWKDQKDLQKAAAMYTRALELMPQEYRLYVEQNMLWSQMGRSAAERLAALENAPPSVRDRWQIAALRAELHVSTESYDKAIEILSTHTFLPWEGARGMRYIYLGAYLGRARRAYFNGDYVGVLEDFRAALKYPLHLGVGRQNPPYRYESEERFWAGMGYMATGQEKEAMDLWQESLLQLARHVTHRPMPQDIQTAITLLKESAREDEPAHTVREKFRQGFACVAEGEASRAFSIFSEAVRENVWPW